MSNDLQQPFGTYALQKRESRLLHWSQSLPLGWFGRRAALILRRIVLTRGQSIIDALVDGLKLRLYMKDNVSERKFLFMPQFCDPYERGLLKQTLTEGSIFVDVGANAGVYTLTAAGKVGDSGRVLSIEPNPVVLERLVFNAGLNKFDKRIITEQSGVSDTEGSFDLTLDDSNLGGSSLVAERSSRKIHVVCHKLLSIVHKHQLSRIDALKIDIEGAEDKALVPFFAEAPRSLYPKIIIVENSPEDWKQDLPAALKAAGYTLQKTTRMNMVWTL
jgi:FkbM family methyltransferase